MTEIEYGFIYKITSPSEKAYIGQVKEYIGKNKTYKGIEGRWKQHINDSKNPKACPAFHSAINKYGYENFLIEKLIKCKISHIDVFEQLLIKTHNTIVPNGYNIQDGGHKNQHTHSENTIDRRSTSMKKLLEDPEKRKIWSEAKKGIRLPKRKCKNACNNDLPKYIYYRESNGGRYRCYVVDHPLGTKSFGKSKFTLEENLQFVVEHLSKLEKQFVATHLEAGNSC